MRSYFWKEPFILSPTSLSAGRRVRVLILPFEPREKSFNSSICKPGIFFFFFLDLERHNEWTAVSQAKRDLKGRDW